MTFFPPGHSAPPPGSDPTLFAPAPATGLYDGSTLVNSGLAPQGPGAVAPFELAFAKPGTYNYSCVIHPQQVGTITVVPAGQTADTAAAVKSRGDQEKGQWLAEGNQALQKLQAAVPVGTKNRDGSTTWKIEMGTSTPHTDILAFAPSPASVKQGDKVTFVNNSMAPHTASFFNQQPPIQSPSDPAIDKVVPRPVPPVPQQQGAVQHRHAAAQRPPGRRPARGGPQLHLLGAHGR